MKPLILLAALCLPQLALAQTDLPAAQVQALAAKLSQRLQDLPPIQSARTTSFPGLIELRSETERILGPKFDRQKFNDFLLAQGLLPPALLLEKAAKGEQF